MRWVATSAGGCRRGPGGAVAAPRAGGNRRGRARAGEAGFRAEAVDPGGFADDLGRRQRAAALEVVDQQPGLLAREPVDPALVAVGCRGSAHGCAAASPARSGPAPTSGSPSRPSASSSSRSGPSRAPTGRSGSACRAAQRSRLISRVALGDEVVAAIQEPAQFQVGALQPRDRERLDAGADRGKRNRGRVDRVALTAQTPGRPGAPPSAAAGRGWRPGRDGSARAQACRRRAGRPRSPTRARRLARIVHETAAAPMVGAALLSA